MRNFFKSRTIQASIIGAAVLIIVTVFTIWTGSNKNKIAVTVTSSNIAIGNNEPVTQIINQNPFPAPSFDYSTSFLNSTDKGLPLTPDGYPYKSSFSISITHAPATNITGSIQWRNDLFSSCSLYSGWSQYVDINGMLRTSGNFVCFSKSPIEDTGNLFQYFP